MLISIVILPQLSRNDTPLIAFLAHWQGAYILLLQLYILDKHQNRCPARFLIHFAGPCVRTVNNDSIYGEQREGGEGVIKLAQMQSPATNITKYLLKISQ